MRGPLERICVRTTHISNKGDNSRTEAAKQPTLSQCPIIGYAPYLLFVRVCLLKKRSICMPILSSLRRACLHFCPFLLKKAGLGFRCVTAFCLLFSGFCYHSQVKNRMKNRREVKYDDKFLSVDMKSR